MSLEGSIKDFGLADIFQLITLQKKSGIMTVTRGDESTTIHIDSGQIVYATAISGCDTKKIGEILIRYGKLTWKNVEDALGLQEKTGEKIGNIFVSSGLASKEDIKDALQAQIKDVLFHILRWKEGWYRFDIGDIDYDREYQIPVQTDFILMESTRMIDEWPYIESKIPSANIIFSQCSRDNIETLFSSLSPDEVAIYNLVDGIRDIRDLVDHIQFSEFEVYKILLTLMLSGLISQTSASKKGEEGYAATGKKRLRIAIQVAVLIFIISFILFLLPIREMAGIDEIMKVSKLLKRKSSEKNLSYLHRSIAYYSLVNGKLPESLDVLYNERYIRKELKTDAWGDLFIYEKYPPENHFDNPPFNYRLYSKNTPLW